LPAFGVIPTVSTVLGIEDGAADRIIDRTHADDRNDLEG
jgi:hypothetical protein